MNEFVLKSFTDPPPHKIRIKSNKASNECANCSIFFNRKLVKNDVNWRLINVLDLDLKRFFKIQSFLICRSYSYQIKFLYLKIKFLCTFENHKINFKLVIVLTSWPRNQFISIKTASFLVLSGESPNFCIDWCIFKNILIA